MFNEPIKLISLRARTESAPEDAPVEESSKFDIDMLRKLEGILGTLKYITINDKVTLKKFIRSLFRSDHSNDTVAKTVWARRFLNPRVNEYLSVASQIADMMAPRTPFANALGFLRNIALLDSLTASLPDKIQSGSQYDMLADLKKSLQQHKNNVCPVNPDDFQHIRTCTVEMGGTLMAYLGEMPIGTRFIATYPGHEAREFELVYRSSDLVCRNGRYEILDSTESKVDFVIKDLPGSENNKSSGDCEPPRTEPVYMFFGLEGSEGVRTKKRYISPANAMGAVFCCNEDSFWISKMTSLPYAVIDATVSQVNICETEVYLIPRKVKEPVDNAELPYSKKNIHNLDEIIHGINIGLSRSYALVGIPGTGKSQFMYELMHRCKDSLIVNLTEMTFDPERNPRASSAQRIIRAVPHQHILVLVDDMDKTEHIGDVPKALIGLFECLHDDRPGGENELSFTFIATINNPTILGNAVIKRSNRFDEVIQMDLPSVGIYAKQLEKLRESKGTNDCTNYRSLWFYPVYRYMKAKSVTLADLSNIYDILRIRCKKTGTCTKFGIRDMLNAAKTIVRNKKNADKEYKL